MRKKIVLILGVSFAICVGLLAHEFWIQPSLTKVKVGEPVSMQIMVGEQFKGERWEGKGDRITLYKHYYHGGAFDLLNSINTGTFTTLHDFTPVFEGTHLIILATNNSFIELQPDEFEAYLMEDGLENALIYRQHHEEQQKNGRERYRRCAKVLIQAGDDTDQTYKESSNLVLEIIPLENPYDLKENKPLSFKINYENKPLSNAKVRCWYKNGEASNVEMQHTSKNGQVSFAQQGDGTYMISTVHMVRLENDSQADWQSTWGSLVFGISR